MLSFQDIILKLQHYWSEKGCILLQPYDMQMGAGTFHPATVIYALSNNPWNVAYVQPSRRPTDSRFGIHPNRLSRYYQFQVILKPSPENSQELFLESLEAIGLSKKENDIRFVEDDWKSPTLGASGLGWEVWCNGMEIAQFTYMQQIAGIPIRPVPVEFTYGLERIAMYVQGKDKFADILWNKECKYSEIDFPLEKQASEFQLNKADTSILLLEFQQAEKQAVELVEEDLPLVAYEFCIKASHIFNLLDARGVISVTEREGYIARVRNITRLCCQKWITT